MQRRTLTSSRRLSNVVRGAAPVWNTQPMQQHQAEIVETEAEKTAREAKEKAELDKETPEQKAVREAKEAKDASDAALQAEKDRAAEAVKAQKAAEKKLADAEKAKLSDTERAVAEKTETAVATAVAEKEQELTDAYEGQLAALRKQIIDSSIDVVLAEAHIERKDVAALLESLDTARFIGDDGSVKVDAIRGALSSLTVHTSKQPPRTSTASRVNGDNRGMGRYLNTK